MKRNRIIIITFALIVLFTANTFGQSYPIVDTGQEDCYDDQTVISAPQPGQPFYGQDAQYNGRQPSYLDNGDGTVTDLGTGLMWQQTPDLDDVFTFAEAVAGVDTFSLAGYDDWRLPTIKELYSLIDFKGSSQTLVPYIDTTYLDFVWGDVIPGNRLIDSQYWSSTEYVGLVMAGDLAAFGVNFADGRIKGYPTEVMPNGSQKKSFVRYVRGNSAYGENDFADNGDGTITDRGAGLMWQKADDGITRTWQEALDYAENLELAGYSDWRLPNAKELQSIVDYTRAPDARMSSQQGSAIDPIFDISEEESWFWTGTTLLEAPPFLGDGSHAVYITFGQAWGHMVDPFTGDTTRVNVHGAGAQRSDPKSGDPGQWVGGFGPQLDEIRIYNHVRCVRGDGTMGLNEDHDDLYRDDTRYVRLETYPNPFNPETTITYNLPVTGDTNLAIYNISGGLVSQLMTGTCPAGIRTVIFDGSDLSSGIYFARLEAGDKLQVQKLFLLK